MSGNRRQYLFLAPPQPLVRDRSAHCPLQLASPGDDCLPRVLATWWSHRQRLVAQCEHWYNCWDTKSRAPAYLAEVSAELTNVANSTFFAFRRAYGEMVQLIGSTRRLAPHSAEWCTEWLSSSDALWYHERCVPRVHYEHRSRSLAVEFVLLAHCRVVAHHNTAVLYEMMWRAAPPTDRDYRARLIARARSEVRMAALANTDLCERVLPLHRCALNRSESFYLAEHFHRSLVGRLCAIRLAHYEAIVIGDASRVNGNLYARRAALCVYASVRADALLRDASIYWPHDEAALRDWADARRVSALVALAAQMLASDGTMLRYAPPGAPCATGSTRDAAALTEAHFCIDAALTLAPDNASAQRIAEHVRQMAAPFNPIEPVRLVRQRPSAADKPERDRVMFIARVDHERWRAADDTSAPALLGVSAIECAHMRPDHQQPDFGDREPRLYKFVFAAAPEYH